MRNEQVQTLSSSPLTTFEFPAPPISDPPQTEAEMYDKPVVTLTDTSRTGSESSLHYGIPKADGGLDVYAKPSSFRKQKVRLSTYSYIF